CIFMSIVATFFFVFIAVMLIAWAVLTLCKSDMNPLQCILWAIAYLLCKFLWRTRWLNRPKLPRGQGAIIVCNHKSSVDPFFVQSSTGRKIHWMVAREYCQQPAFGAFLRSG